MYSVGMTTAPPQRNHALEIMNERCSEPEKERTDGGRQMTQAFKLSLEIFDLQAVNFCFFAKVDLVKRENQETIFRQEVRNKNSGQVSIERFLGVYQNDFYRPSAPADIPIC